nr:hypothetical protein [Tanacetum cinerariifolium]
MFQIYMQEFWATAKLHQHSIRFKMDTKKHVLDLEAFREMLHISPRIPGQSLVELPFKEEILEFLRFLGHSTQIKTLIDVNPSTLDETELIGITSGMMYCSLRSSKAYKEYYACATGEAAPKLKASTRKKTSGFASSTTPPTPIATSTPTTTVVAAPRLSAAAKGKQPTRATTPTESTDGREESKGDKTNESDDDADDQDEADKVNDDDDDEEETTKSGEQEAISLSISL